MGRNRQNLRRAKEPGVAAVVHTKTPETWGLWRLILEGLAVLIECCVFQLLSGLLPVRTGNLPFRLAFRSIVDSVPDQPSGSAFQLNLRLASVIASFGYFPTDFDLRRRQIFQLAFVPISSFRLQLTL